MFTWMDISFWKVFGSFVHYNCCKNMKYTEFFGPNMYLIEIDP